MTDEFGRIVVQDHRVGTQGYSPRLSNGAQYDLNVKVVLNVDPAHADQLTNRGERSS
ncbi:hypothetical protein [Paraburkholderia bannensis]|uniref:hypothetical protein n=1 Tax=Paraburkholderia bannensis TaxID=765414 RepID=UPI002AB254AF|nr:hypothetical protein [Paraburkholderia bannensis]